MRRFITIVILLLFCNVICFADTDVYSIPVYFAKNVTGNVGFSSKYVSDYIPPDTIITEATFSYTRMGNSFEFRTDPIYLFCQVYTLSPITLSISVDQTVSSNISWQTTLPIGDSFLGSKTDEPIILYEEDTSTDLNKPRLWNKEFYVSVSPDDVSVSNETPSAVTIGRIIVTVTSGA